MEMVNSFKRYLRAIVPQMVFKSMREAEASETPESRLYGDEYVAAMLQTDNLLVMRTARLTEAIFNTVGIFDKNTMNAMREDVELIPYDKRNTILKLCREEIISTYIERNNYYRMLNGLPDLGQYYIFIEPEILNSYGYYNDTQENYDNQNFDNLTPLHRLPQNVLNAMEAKGYLEYLYNYYEKDSDYSREYIKHLGLKRVDIVRARMAGHLELLYLPRPENANRFNRDFILYYEEARHYMLTQIYNYHYSSSHEYYESYIGFFTLIMAIQRMVDSMFEVMVDRDFYDLETCRMFLEAYGVPFINSFTFRQQKTLVKNLNILIMNKCTSQVMFDILNLMEFDNYTLTKYFLVKQHKTSTSEGELEPKPIFIYRTVMDENGEVSYELDKGETYDYYFVGVPLDEKDNNLVDIDDVNSHSYSAVTVPDALWIEDNDLITTLQESEINFTETKYMNVAVAIHMQEVLFEHIYLQKLLFDKQYETSNISVELSLMSPVPVSLFELEIILICITAKYYHIEPDLLTSPSKSLAVLGFNFDTDLELIKEEIRNHSEYYDQKLIDYIENIHFYSASDVNNMYRNVKMIARILTQTMELTQNPYVYYANKKLYQALLITDVHNEVLTLPNGTLPETYMDWLKAYDLPMYEYIDKLDSDACIDKINYIAVKMATMFIDTEYLKYLSPIDLTLVNGITRLLNWFKSYTIDIRDMEVIYMFDSKYNQLMKMMNKLWFHTKIYTNEYHMTYNEWLRIMFAHMIKKENMTLLFDLIRSAHANGIYRENQSSFFDKEFMSSNAILREFIIKTYSDSLIYMKNAGLMSLTEKDGILTESLNAFAEALIREGLDEDGLAFFRDIIVDSHANEIIIEAMKNLYAEVIKLGSDQMSLSDTAMKLKDFIEFLNEKIHINEKLDNKNKFNFKAFSIIREFIIKVYSEVLFMGTKSIKFEENIPLQEYIEVGNSTGYINENLLSKDNIVFRAFVALREFIIRKYSDSLLMGTKFVKVDDSILMKDFIEFLNVNERINEKLSDKERLEFHVFSNLRDFILKKYSDTIVFGTKSVKVQDNVPLREFVDITNSTGHIDESSIMKDDKYENLKMKVITFLREIAITSYADSLLMGTKYERKSEGFNFDDVIKQFNETIIAKDKLNISDTEIDQMKSSVGALIKTLMFTKYIDVLRCGTKVFQKKEFFHLQDILGPFYETLHIKDIRVFKDTFHLEGASESIIKEVMAQYYTDFLISGGKIERRKDTIDFEDLISEMRASMIVSDKSHLHYDKSYVRLIGASKAMLWEMMVGYYCDSLHKSTKSMSLKDESLLREDIDEAHEIFTMKDICLHWHDCFDADVSSSKILKDKSSVVNYSDKLVEAYVTGRLQENKGLVELIHFIGRNVNIKETNHVLKDTLSVDRVNINKVKEKMLNEYQDNISFESSRLIIGDKMGMRDSIMLDFHNQ